MENDAADAMKTGDIQLQALCLSNSWIISIILYYMALNRTPNMNC